MYMTESWLPLAVPHIRYTRANKDVVVNKNVKTTAVGRSLNFEPDWRI